MAKKADQKNKKIQSLGLVHVILPGDLFVVKTPAFRDISHCINTPMNKNAKLGIFEPSHFILNRIRIYFLLCAADLKKKNQHKRKNKFQIIHLS
jgi:hypothetical protein